MITEALLNFVFIIAGGLTSLLPSISWSVDSSVFRAFFDILSMVGYLLPIPTVVSILQIVIAIGIFKIVVSLIKTIWKLLPFA